MLEELLPEFKKIAEAFTKEATSSKKKALKVLVDSGIYTADGELSPNYR